MKKVLLLDVDGVICFSGYVDAINDYLNTNYDEDYFKGYYIEDEVLKEDEKEAFYDFVSKRNLYENPKMLPDAVETIKKLSEKYEIYMCSAYVNAANVNFCGEQISDKYYFLLRTFPFINPKHFIFASHKLMINADVRIDDKITNLGDAQINILFPSNHNLDLDDKDLEEKNIVRAGKDWKVAWKEIEKILL